MIFFKFLNKETQDVNLLDDNRKDAIGIMASKVNENIQLTKEVIVDDIKFMEEVKNIVSQIKKRLFISKIRV